MTGLGRMSSFQLQIVSLLLVQLRLSRNSHLIINSPGLTTRFNACSFCGIFHSLRFHYYPHVGWSCLQLACVADRLNNRHSHSVQRLPKACSEFTGISVSLSNWIDSYALCNSTLTHLTNHASDICMTEKVLCRNP